jgi:hypothetical protein
MRRFLTLATALALAAPLGLVGCGEENKTETKTTGPGGTTVEKKSTTQSGENPPAPTGTSGEPGPKTP